MEILADVLVLVGAAFLALAGIGVVRFKDLFARMHAATKASTIAVVLIAAAAVLTLDHGAPTVVLAAILTFLTAPSAAHLVARAAYRDEHLDVGLDGIDDLADLADD
ncbi:MAG: monovalent cation/H(+) antiporter subunit G [Actinobacteria bacterium]|nr:monovalent cation/H(+) antiporter subunit G [Actinomycetota bacterium]